MPEDTSTEAQAIPDSDVLSVERDGAVATVWLDRPGALNAMGPDFFADMPASMAALSEDSSVRCIVIAARGSAFSAGLDLKTMGMDVLQPDADKSPVQNRQELLEKVRYMQKAMTTVDECRKPVIAAIHGACIGGGVDLATACDIRLAASDATFSVRETRLAMVADLGTLQRLPRIVSDGHVAELVYTGKDVDAVRAKEIGLVNHGYDSDESLHRAAGEMAQEIASNSPLAVQGAKSVLRAGRSQTVEEGLEHVALWNSAFLQSEDLAEAVSAFMDKRAPNFSGK
ncbi:enoyl-CoA hydratase [Longibacter salinarum]|uniref:Enoyl-CoA hydratase n=1 Tax=Longibacter salinarum TaxID=1850348 RepID=A0A2A8CW47_9BACT|nr:crotonase/enoyl-CoA hydratase family protein [Longibacter salinarum]PEN12843.1 enoyl-CoA hydratase [Longibacter salinarum]